MRCGFGSYRKLNDIGKGKLTAYLDGLLSRALAYVKEFWNGQRSGILCVCRYTNGRALDISYGCLTSFLSPEWSGGNCHIVTRRCLYGDDPCMEGRGKGPQRQVGH